MLYIKNIKLMGGVPSEQSELMQIRKFVDGLDHVMNTQSSCFGVFKIYKMTQKPYEYIMEKTFTMPQGDPHIIEKHKWYRQFKSDKNIVKMDLINFEEKEETCGRYRKLSLYCRYYFFTLSDAITKKIQRKNYFSEHQIFYVVRTLLNIWEFLHQNDNSYWGYFRSKFIFLSPQGFIKVYPWIGDWSEEDLPETLSETRRSSYNGELIFTNKPQKKESFDGEPNSKDDLRDIGLLLFQMINLGKQQDYRKDHEPKYEMITFLLNQFNQNPTLFEIYKPLLKGLINPNTKQILGLWDLREQLHNIEEKFKLKNVFCVKLVDNDATIGEPQVTNQSEEQERGKKLKNIVKSNKLVASSIQTVMKKKY